MKTKKTKETRHSGGFFVAHCPTASNADGGGLYLLVNPNGSKWWRRNYRIAGKRKTLSMGTYPETTLAEARGKHAAARRVAGAGD
ncbi:DUF4102 domain-containing protein [Dyella lipolytica]|uniref:DUF4102 domain-containing protein n=1 Tax=Dyella lipolytica TaxID=1867835 RepID=A0ABW8J061_9GAMM